MEQQKETAPIVVGSRRFPAPYDWDNVRRDDREMEYAVFLALVAKGIGDHDAPSKGDVATFPFVAATVEALSGEVLTLGPRPLFCAYNDRLEWLLWGELWQACTVHGARWPQEFRNVLLRLFLPQTTHAPPERPYAMSTFVRMWLGRWDGEPVLDAPFRSVGNLRRAVERSGLAAYRRDLSDELRLCVDQVTAHVPGYLYEACRS